MSDNGITVEAVDYHRNGVGGMGYYVAIVTDTTEDGGPGRMLVIDFTGAQDADYREYGYTAVLNLDEAANGNVYMHPQDGKPDTGNNAWRGDRLGDRYRGAIKAKHEEASAR